MIVNVKIYPIAGLNDSAKEKEVTLSEGCLSELLTILGQKLGDDLRNHGVMILNNGHSLDIDEEATLTDGDKIWVMPRLSGG